MAEWPPICREKKPNNLCVVNDYADTEPAKLTSRRTCKFREYIREAENFSQNCFSLCIRSPGGVSFTETSGPKPKLNIIFLFYM